MQYVAPYGVSDPNAPYINGNPQTGVQGSIPPAAAFEHPMRELVAMITNANYTPNSGDLQQLTQAVRSQYVNYCVDTGGVNTLVVTLQPPVSSYTVGLPLRVKVRNTNTSNTVTLNAGGASAAIKKMDGSNPAVGDLPAGGIIEVTYDGTNWQLTNFGGGAGGGGTTTTINIPYAADTGTVNTLVAAFSPAITSLIPGSVFLVKLANTVTGGPVTIAINALAAKNIKITDGTDPLPADWVAGDVMFIKYDGTKFICEPDDSIIVNCTFNVPSTQFPTIASVFTALKRKSISPSAIVTVQLANGTYPCFAINHPNADQIVVKGNMKAAQPVLSDFARTGNSSAARAADSATNIVMLRARYGSEIHYTDSDLGAFVAQYAVGITNLGPGMPTVQDVLVTGPNAQSTNYASNGVMIIGTKIRVKNVAVWGSGGNGFVSSKGQMEGQGNLYACGNFYDGFLGADMKFWFPVFGLGNAVCGAQAASGTVNCVSLNGAHHFECNGVAGGAATDNGLGIYKSSTMINNGSNGDVWAYGGAHAMVYNATYGVANPTPGVQGNGFAYIDNAQPDQAPY